MLTADESAGRFVGSWFVGAGLQTVMQDDITEFQPYFVQLVAQLLERRGEPIPENYLQILPSLLQQGLWASKANQPALTRLIKAYLKRCAPKKLSEWNPCKSCSRVSC